MPDPRDPSSEKGSNFFSQLRRAAFFKIYAYKDVEQRFDGRDAATIEPVVTFERFLTRRIFAMRYASLDT